MSDESELHIVETTPVGADPNTDPSADASTDVIHGRPPRPPVRWSVRPTWLAGLLAVVLVGGIGIGYAVGRHGKRPTAAHPSATPTSAAPTRFPPAGSALAEVPQVLKTGTTCFGVAASSGQPLMVGVEITNGADRPLVITNVEGDFPLGGLRQLDSQIGQCDNNATEPVSGHRVEPTAIVWVSLTLDVQVRCPAPLPVAFRVDYTIDGVPGTETLRAFPDLGRVPYPACPTPS
jgi:hypothetical protein